MTQRARASAEAVERAVHLPERGSLGRDDPDLFVQLLHEGAPYALGGIASGARACRELVLQIVRITDRAYLKNLAKIADSPAISVAIHASQKSERDTADG